MRGTLKIVVTFFIFLRASQGQTVPQRSLLLVCDATGSMRDDLDAVHEGSKFILDFFENKSNNPIKNYVLTFFRDPGWFI
jgi:hypothetical protein